MCAQTVCCWTGVSWSPPVCQMSMFFLLSDFVYVFKYLFSDAQKKLCSQNRTCRLLVFHELHEFWEQILFSVQFPGWKSHCLSSGRPAVTHMEISSLSHWASLLAAYFSNCLSRSVLCFDGDMAACLLSTVFPRLSSPVHCVSNDERRQNERVDELNEDFAHLLRCEGEREREKVQNRYHVVTPTLSAFSHLRIVSQGISLLWYSIHR